jgi:hypothetical protein
MISGKTRVQGIELGRVREEMGLTNGQRIDQPVYLSAALQVLEQLEIFVQAGASRGRKRLADGPLQFAAPLFWEAQAKTVQRQLAKTQVFPKAQGQFLLFCIGTNGGIHPLHSSESSMPQAN